MREPFGKIRLGTAVGAVFAAALTGLVFDGDAARPHGTVGLSLLVAGVGAVLIMVAVFGSRGRRILVALGAAAGAVLVVLGALDDIGKGTPGPFMPVLALTSAVFAVAMACGCFTASEERSGRALVVATAVTVVVIVGLGTIFEPSVRRLPASARLTTAGEASPVPSVPGREAWRLPLPEDTPFRWQGDIVAAGTGVVTELPHPHAPARSVKAVDGTTGDVTWWSMLDGAHLRNLTASPDGSVVVATFAPGGGQDTDRVRLVTFDAFTGETLAMLTVDDYVGSTGFAVTDRTVVLSGRDLGDGDRNDIVGIDLRTGTERWRNTRPGGCDVEFSLPHNTPRSSLHTLRCDTEAVVVAYAGDTGEERWRFTATAAELGATSDRWSVDSYVSSASSSDHVSVRLSGRGDASGVVDALVSDSDGAVLPFAPDIRVGGPIAVSAPVVGDELLLPPGSVEWQPTGWTSEQCGSVRTSATTDRAVIVVCEDGNRRSQLPFVQTLDGEIRDLPFDTLRGAVPAPGAIVVLTDDAYIGLDGP